MPNPLNTLVKPVAFGTRQAISITQTALRTGGAIVGALTGDDEGQQPDEHQAPPRRSTQPKQFDDVAITRKVESEIFRDSSAPKGKIDVNTASGVVWLRGEAKNPEMIKRLERQARAIPEVRRVENLLHLPKTPAPSRADTPARQRKTRTTRAPQPRRKPASPVTAERKPAAAEPGPSEHSSEGTGRTPAPLGSRDSEAGEPPAGGDGGQPGG